MLAEGEAEAGPPLPLGLEEGSLRFAWGEGRALEGDSHLDLLFLGWGGLWEEAAAVGGF